MEKRLIDGHFTKERSYFENSIGREFDFTPTSGPYEYLLGALAGCFAKTLQAYLTKNSIPYSSFDIHIEGIKREEAPTMLKHTLLAITASGVADKESFSTFVEKTKEKCSIFCTIKAVSEMEVELSFKD